MPYGDPEPGDPMKLVGMALPGGPETVSEMAYTFAEEFARLGYSEKALLSLFKMPFYRGAHSAYCALGDEEVRKIVRECVGVWGRIRCVDRDAVEIERNNLHRPNGWAG